MPTTVVKSIGTSSRDYSTLQAWEDAAPVDLTLTRSNTATGGSSSTITLDAGASGTDGLYVGLTVTNASSQERLITGYVGATKVATIGALNGSSATWTAPTNGSAFTINSVIWQGQCYNDSEFFNNGGGSSIIFSGSTSDSTHYKDLTVATGQSFQDNASVRLNALTYNIANGVGIRCHVLSDTPIRIGETYARFSRFQVQFDQRPYNATTLKVDGAPAGIVVRDCLFDALNNNTSATVILSCNDNVNVIKAINLVTFLRGSSGGGLSIERTTAIGCIIVRSSDQAAAGTGVISGFEHTVIQSCAIFGFTNATDNGSGFDTPNCKNNATDQSSGIPGSGQKYNVPFSATSPFKQAAVSGYDLRAVSGSPLAFNGFLDSTNAPNDISGFPRPANPTIGAWELGLPVPVPFVDECQSIVFRNQYVPIA